MILVKSFYAQNDLRNYSYLIQDKESGEAWVIDPYEANPIINYIKENGLTLKGILNTHHHWDHIQGNGALAEAFKAPICKVKNSESISLSQKHAIEVLDTPGHTSDHQVFIWKENHEAKGLFAGDTLFNAGVGNCRNGGNVDDLYETTEKLLKILPKETILYPGHDYRKRNLEFSLNVEPENERARDLYRRIQGEKTEELPFTDLAYEVQVNPFLRLNSDELRHNHLKKDPLSSTESRRELFKTLRSLRDHW